jgi:hypothetical protein
MKKKNKVYNTDTRIVCSALYYVLLLDQSEISGKKCKIIEPNIYYFQLVLKLTVCSSQDSNIHSCTYTFKTCAAPWWQKLAAYVWQFL